MSTKLMESTVKTDQTPYSIFNGTQKRLIIAIVSIAATFSGLSTNIYFPALPNISRNLHVTPELTNLTVTSYLIFQGIAPSLWASISDVKGRRIAYILTFLVYIGACIGLAETKNYASLVILRCLQSTGSASTVAIGAGVTGDITTRAERGGYMGVFQAGLLVPLGIGPVIGGAISGTLGWRWIFWILTIYAVVFIIVLIVFLPETLRSLVGNGSLLPSFFVSRFPLNVYQRHVKIEPTKKSAEISKIKKIDFLGPLRILISKQAAPIIISLAIYYATWQMSVTVMSSLFDKHYGLSEIQVGLTFIANGVGSTIGTLVTGKMVDLDYRRVKAKYESQLRRDEEGNFNDETDTYDQNFPLEKARLRLVPIFAIVQCLALIVFGWTVQYSVHISVPIISTFFTGWSAVSMQAVITTYLVDIYYDKSAAATASLNLARCLFGAGGTSFIMPLINAVGVGITFIICVAVQLVALIGPWIQWKYGVRWRKEKEKRRRMEMEDRG